MAENPKNPGGRPRLLTPELLRKVLLHFPLMLYWDSVAAFAGVDARSFRRWLQRGRRELARLESPENEPRESEAIYAELVLGIEKALAESMAFAVGVVKKAAAGSADQPAQWAPACWLLERRWPELWGRDTRRVRELEKQVEAMSRQIAELLGSAGR